MIFSNDYLAKLSYAYFYTSKKLNFENQEWFSAADVLILYFGFFYNIFRNNSNPSFDTDLFRLLSSKFILHSAFFYRISSVLQDSNGKDPDKLNNQKKNI